MITAIVPAAGMSMRMGQNKLLLTYKGKSLIARAVDTLLASAVEEIIVVLGHEASEVRRQLRGRSITLVENPCYRDGMSTSIRAGLQSWPRSSDAIMIYLADQPLLEPEDVKRIIQAFGQAGLRDKGIVVPFFQGQRGNPVILGSPYRKEMLELEGDVGCKPIIARHPDDMLALEMETDHVIRDVDNVEDYQRLSEFIGGQP